MKDYKNIDRLFQEKFRDFEQNPSSHLWKNISDILSGKVKNDRRVLWLWLSGVAAGLALLVIFNNPFATTIITPNTNTTDTNEINNNNSKTVITNTTTEDINTTQPKTNKLSPKKEEVTTNTTHKNYSLTPTKTKNTSNIKRLRVDKTYVVSNESSDKKNNTAIPNLKEDISENKSLIAQTNKTLIEPSYKSVVNSTENSKKPDNSTALNNTVPKERTNTIPLESVNKNKSQSDVVKAEKKSKNWIVSTVAAPVIFGAFDKDVSSIDSQFNNNTKKGQLSAAYGVQLAYQINDRFRIQSGLHKVDYGYKTYDVYVSPDRYASVYSNITYDDGINIIDINAAPHSGSGQEYETDGNNDIEGSLTQILGYYEIPLETKYNLKKGNFGINLLSGFSTLILSKNEIYIQTEEFSSKVGEASNLNSLNFTGNLGLELEYQLYKNMHFNFTPVFKIHANTFKKDTGGFNPYAIGIYSGLNYRF